MKKIGVLLFFLIFFTRSVSAAADNTMFMMGTVKVTQNGQPVANAEVEAFDQGKTTDSNGSASFEHLVSGKRPITVTYNGHKYSQIIDINSANVQFNLNKPSTDLNSDTSFWNSSFGKRVLVSAIVLILFILFFRFYLLKVFKTTNIQAILASPAVKITGLAAFLVVIIGGMFAISQQSSNKNITYQYNQQSKAAELSTLPVPSNITVEQDDRLAIFSIGSPGESAQGYYIEWGTASNPFTDHQLSEAPLIELQPLQNGTPYVARFYTVDSFGNRSAASQTISFTGSSARVDALRTQMNGFFDDFNLPYGAFDELKWNNAYSGCVGQGEGGQFVNTQFHAHNQLETVNCDRGQDISRPRTIFDFSNGQTRTITFDFDGVGRRDQWYLDLYPLYGSDTTPHDISGHVDLEDVGNPQAQSDPPYSLRIHQTQNTVKIFQFDANGVEQNTNMDNTLCGGGGSANYNQLTFCKNPDGTPHPLTTIANVRRHWKIQMSQTRTTVFIDDIKVADATYNLPYNRAYLLWTAFSYNTPKSNERSVLMHWDNFGFDAPAGFQKTIETHNYISGLVGTQDNGSYYLPRATASSPLHATIKIPDSIKDKNGNNPVEARLMFTLQSPGSFELYNWTSSDSITVNGKTYPFPKPTTTIPSIPFERLVGVYYPYNAVIKIPASDINTVLKTGDNDVSFNFGPSGIFNTHIELDYPISSAPTYTQPAQIYSNYTSKIVPAIPDIGPDATFTHICPASTSDADCLSGTYDIFGKATAAVDANYEPIYLDWTDPALSGQKKLHIDINNEIARTGSGKNSGIDHYNIYIDRKLIFSKQTNATVPAPAVSDFYTWDTSQYCNGEHEVFLQAYNPNGTVSIPDYVNFHGDIIQGQYFYMRVATSNSGQSSCGAISGPTPAPYPNGTQPPTPTPISVTNPPVTLTPTPTTVPGATATPTRIPTPTPTSASSGNLSPFHGTPSVITSTIQAEDFDNGGEGIAYHDTDTINEGGANYRQGGVDIEPTADAAGGGYTVGWNHAGEWYAYTVSVPATGTYTLQARVANVTTGGNFHIEIDGADKTGSIAIPNTGGWTTFQTISKTGITLPSGQHILKLVMDTNTVNGDVGDFNWFVFNPVSVTPTGSAPTNTPIVTPRPTNTPTPRPTNTPVPQATNTPVPSCAMKAQGDANCDGSVDLIDFEAWRQEYTGQVNTKNADFNSDSTTDLIDFEIWRSNFVH